MLTCLGQNNLKSCLDTVRYNHVEMWRCHLCTHKDTCVAPALRRMAPFRSRDGARLLRPWCTARSTRLRIKNCACAPNRTPSSTANGTRGCPPVDPPNWSIGGHVGVELPVLHQLGWVPMNSPSLPLPRVHIGGGDQPIQQTLNPKPRRKVVRHHNVPKPRFVLTSV